MSKRSSTKDLENKGSAKKKSKKELLESKWRSKFLQYKNPRIKLAVAASLRDQLPIILIKDIITYKAKYYMFWPKNQEIGERVLNLLECQYSYGHREDNDESYPKGDFASCDHMCIVEALCQSSSDDEKGIDEVDIIDIYFQTTPDQIGRVEEVDDFTKLPPLLYFQPCYGYF